MKPSKETLVRLALILALLTQVSHAAYVFSIISKTQSLADDMLSYAFALSLELSTYIFTIWQKRRTATFFAIVGVCINFLYYWKGSVFDFHFWSSTVISLILPFSIWQYSDLVVADIKKHRPLITDTKPVAKKVKNRKRKSNKASVVAIAPTPTIPEIDEHELAIAHN